MVEVEWLVPLVRFRTVPLIGRVVGYKASENLNLRLSKATKGWQVEYHQMGRMRVDKKIFGAPRW
jgi:hypothetical protein